jgi:hypothetical protein
MLGSESAGILPDEQPGRSPLAIALSMPIGPRSTGAIFEPMIGQ